MKKKLCLFALLTSMASYTHAHSSNWSYEAPAEWGNLSVDYQTCKSGVNQSPVDIRQVVNGQLPPLTLSYQAKQQSIINNGHTIQINMKDGDVLKLDGETFTLRQFHFHTPSENLIDGKRYPLAAHFVHASEEGHLAVVGVMFETGAENPALAEILREMPPKVNQELAMQHPLSLSDLIPGQKHYYRFSGSLTTPPCTEGVRWLVMKQTVSASAEQIKTFAKLLGEHGNSRPVQPLNGRVIIE
jgi:carbonic anhydrase